jgi:sugar phosphate isomerase/epimerase
MSHLRLSLATAPFGLPLRVAIDRALGCGAQGIQFELRDQVRVNELGETGRKQLLHYLTERNLTVGPATFSLRRALADRIGMDERLAALRTAMDDAWKLGARSLTFRLGELPGSEDETGRDLLRQLLTDLAQYANRVGVVPVLIPTAEPAAQLRALLDPIKEGPLALELDPATLHVGRRALGDWVRELHRLIAHVSLRDVIRDVTGFGKEVVMGRGEVDWDEVAALLQEVDYRGWLTVIRNGGTDPIEEALRAVTFSKNVLLAGQ